LKAFVESIRIPNAEIKVEFVNSKKSIPLQICDLLMGAAGYYGNKVDWDLLPGKRRRTKNQMMKSDFGKNIYNILRRIDSHYRGSKAFNWFETTGIDGDRSNRYHHKMRIWKFIPSNSNLILVGKMMPSEPMQFAKKSCKDKGHPKVSPIQY
jgi:hypothetical protein